MTWRMNNGRSKWRTTVPLNQQGISSLDFMLSLSLIAVLIFFAVRIQSHYVDAAYETVLKHDVTQFARMVVVHYHNTGDCFAIPGKTFTSESDSILFMRYGFQPSEDISIHVISGNPDDPYNADNPLTFKAEHPEKHYSVVYDLHSLSVRRNEVP